MPFIIIGNPYTERLLEAHKKDDREEIDRLSSLQNEWLQEKLDEVKGKDA